MNVGLRLVHEDISGATLTGIHAQTTVPVEVFEIRYNKFVTANLATLAW